MESESQSKKIEETVIGILKDADLEEATEFKVRTVAAERLGIDLSDLDHKWLVRRVVESYLLSLEEDKEGKVEEQTKEIVREQGKEQNIKAKEGSDDWGGVICKLSEKRAVAVHDFRGKTLVSIRDYYRRDGKLLHSARGISLSTEQWSAFRRSVPDVEAAIRKMETQIRSENAGRQIEAKISKSATAVAQGCMSMETNQTGTGMSNSATTSAPQGLTPSDTSNSAPADAPHGISLIPTSMETNQTETEISNSAPASAPQGLTPSHTSNSATADGPQGISPIQTSMETDQTEAEKSNSAPASAPQGISPIQTCMETNQTETEISNSAPQGLTTSHTSNSATADGPQGISPIQTSMETDQTETEKSNSDPASAPQGLTPIDASNSLTASAPQGPSPIQTFNSVNASASGSAPQGLFSVPTSQSGTAGPRGVTPIQTIRLDGKNYHFWVHQMEFFLKQLKIAYVLNEPCPSIGINPEANSEEIAQAKVAVQKWVDDDYICCHFILNSLSDHLFDQYSRKTKSAKELWEELKLAYNKDIGTKRSQVNKYIQFQMIDGISIVEQVQELHRIADSIIAFGMQIDEYFHVSAIISKLPPSWKEYRMKLMREDFLPLNMLMFRLRLEEESRNHAKKEEPFLKAHVVEPRAENKLGPKKTDLKRPGMHWEMDKENKAMVCYKCGKKGHISRNCHTRFVYIREKTNEESEVAPAVEKAKVAERIAE